MNEESAFLLDILAHPDDEAPRLIYADWLEDHDDERADLFRRGWQLRGHFTSQARQQREAFARQCRERGWTEYDGLVLTDQQLVLMLRFFLAETMLFCGERHVPLNTPQLEPRSLVGLSGMLDWPRASTADWLAMGRQLALERRRLLRQAGLAVQQPASSLRGGRLVLCDPQSSRVVSDFAISSFSQRFFGLDRLPCWDTWVIALPGVIEERVGLIAFVPRIHLPRASAGLVTDSSGCVGWLDEADLPLTRLLRASGLFQVR
jgi:uncharacterized protein (TIGR02996 family)